MKQRKLIVLFLLLAVSYRISSTSINNDNQVSKYMITENLKNNDNNKIDLKETAESENTSWRVSEFKMF